VGDGVGVRWATRCPSFRQMISLLGSFFLIGSVSDAGRGHFRRIPLGRWWRVRCTPDFPAPDRWARHRPNISDESFAPMYDLTCGMARLEPPPPEMLALYQALRDNPIERDPYFGTLGNTVSIPECYAPENLQRIAASAAAGS
jgi:hypothetical protein